MTVAMMDVAPLRHRMTGAQKAIAALAVGDREVALKLCLVRTTRFLAAARRAASRAIADDRAGAIGQGDGFARHRPTTMVWAAPASMIAVSAHLRKPAIIGRPAAARSTAAG